MDVLTTTLGVLVIILLCCTYDVKSENRQVITFNAANTSVLRDEQTGVHIVKFVKLRNKYNEVVPSKILQVKTYKDCLLNCVSTGKCTSTNLAKSTNPNGQFDCWLLETNLFKNFTNLKDNAKYHFFNIQVRQLAFFSHRLFLL